MREKVNDNSPATDRKRAESLCEWAWTERKSSETLHRTLLTDDAIFALLTGEKRQKLQLVSKKTPINEYKRTIIAQRTEFSFEKSALKIAVSTGKMCAIEQAKRKARDENEEEQEVRKPTKRRTCWKHEADAS